MDIDEKLELILHEIRGLSMRVNALGAQIETLEGRMDRLEEDMRNLNAAQEQRFEAFREELPGIASPSLA